MTREEAIVDIRDNIKSVVGGKSLDMAIEALEQEPFDIETYCKEHFVVMVDRDVWEKAEKALEQEPRWIPVSEKLPEIHQDVLLSLRSLDIEVGFRAETEPYFYCHGDYIEPQNVIAWMPLPTPYRAESEVSE